MLDLQVIELYFNINLKFVMTMYLSIHQFTIAEKTGLGE